MNKKINQYGSHFIDQVDIQKVIKVLENKDLTSGTEVLKFEHEFSKKNWIKVCCYLLQWDNAALHLAILSLGLKKMI